MLSENQRFEQLRKLFLILEALPSCENIGEISEKNQYTYQYNSKISK